jgi:uncharacterized membrane protein
MPFCTQCGGRVETTSAYCAQCGTPQPNANAWAYPPGADFLNGISERNASILCYIPYFGIIPSIVFLASRKFRHNQHVRFNAFQSIYLFVAHLIVSSVDHGYRGFGSLLETLLLICWIFLLIKAAQNEQVHLPVIGDLAARSASEQL